MNKPKSWLAAAAVAAVTLPLVLLGATADPAQAGAGPGKVATTQAGRPGESDARTSAPSWGWPIGW